VNFDLGVVYVRFIGTHRHYDAIGRKPSDAPDGVTVRPVRSAADYRVALAEIERLMLGYA
jgi:hypothetical protein